MLDLYHGSSFLSLLVKNVVSRNLNYFHAGFLKQGFVTLDHGPISWIDHSGWEGGFSKVQS